MEKLDSYGDNFRNIPICVPNETEQDAQQFKEKIANKNINSYPYFQDGELHSTQSSVSNLSFPVPDNISSWKGSSFESGEAWNSILAHGHKKSKKQKKEKKESKR